MLKLWWEILNGLPQYISAESHDDPAYSTYRQIPWLLPPPYTPAHKLSKAAEKARKSRDAALTFLGESQNEFQALQRQVPEELHFHKYSSGVPKTSDLFPSLKFQLCCGS